VAPRNPERTRARILSAARREFAAKGIAGARVDAIARRAGINKRMLYHYFGSKDGLFVAVLQRTLDERVAHVAGESPDAAGRLRARSKFYAGAGDYVRLLMWEALERPAIEAADRPERAAAYARLRSRIEQDQAAGELPAEFDSGLWALAELAIGLMPIAFPQLTRMQVGLDVHSDEFQAAHQDFLTQLAARLGGAIGAPAPPPGEESPTL
jgi:TetR/AcrR family transcriptional regulator